MADLNVTITLSTRTCNCGAIYALPTWTNSYCPKCAERHHDAEMESMARQRDEARHSAATYKGQNTRLRKLLNGKG